MTWTSVRARAGSRTAHSACAHLLIASVRARIMPRADIYFLFERVAGGKLPREYCTIRLSPRAKAVSEATASRTVLVLGAAQATLILLMKFGKLSNSVGLIWAVPLISLAMRWAYTCFPTVESELAAGAVVLQLLMLTAFVALVPACGAASLLGGVLGW